MPKAALERIAEYCGKAPAFPDAGALEAYLRDVHASFGSLTDGQWRHLATHGSWETEDGVSLTYDPGIAVPFKAIQPMTDVDLWSVWDAIWCPVLGLRGEISYLLSAEIATEIAVRGPKATTVEVGGCRHAPALMADDLIEIVND